MDSLTQEANSACAEIIMSIGSNTAERTENVHRALAFLATVLENFHSSGVYASEAIAHGKGIYANAVVKGTFRGTADSLERMAKEMEIAAGRDEEARRQGIVPLDIDLVRYADTMIRPREYERAYFKEGLKRMDG